MTRETKVGLLVGLGIILLVGIIVSDHLSLVNDQSPADLTQFAPQSQRSIATTNRDRPRRRFKTDDRPGSRPRLTTERRRPDRPLGPSKPLPVPSVAPPRPQVAPPKRYGQPEVGQLATRRAPSSTSVPTLSQTGSGRTANRAVNSSKKDSSPVSGRSASSVSAKRQPVIHYVKSGESLWQIAQRYYHNGESWRWIAEANPQAVQANGGVRVGVRLVIPSEPSASASSSNMTKPQSARASRVRKTSSATVTNRGRVRRSSAKTYTVVENDSLYKIAARTLGNGGRWEEIYQANRDLLDHPDQLKAGQRLKIPN